jgi:hypothetical protein
MSYFLLRKSLWEKFFEVKRKGFFQFYYFFVYFKMCQHLNLSLKEKYFLINPISLDK